MKKLLSIAALFLASACGGNNEESTVEIYTDEVGSIEQAISVPSTSGSSFAAGWGMDRCVWVDSTDSCYIPRGVGSYGLDTSAGARPETWSSADVSNLTGLLPRVTTVSNAASDPDGVVVRMDEDESLLYYSVPVDKSILVRVACLDAQYEGRAYGYGAKAYSCKEYSIKMYGARIESWVEINKYFASMPAPTQAEITRVRKHLLNWAAGVIRGLPSTTPLGDSMSRTMRFSDAMSTSFNRSACEASTLAAISNSSGFTLSGTPSGC